MMKRFLTICLCSVFFILSAAFPAFAEDSSRSYSFDIAVNGKSFENTETGDTVFVTLTFRRTDSGDGSEIYAVQDEILFDSSFFELSESGILAASGVEMHDVSLQGNEHALYVSFVSFGGGEFWENEKVLVSFPLKVIAESGTSSLVNSHCLVSTKDGLDSFAVSQTDASVSLSEECLVTFDPQNGEKPEKTSAEFGAKLAEPKEPSRSGYDFSGWHKTKSLAEQWNFDKDTVVGNMTLYAGWQTAKGAETVNAEPEHGIVVPVLLLVLFAIVLVAGVFIVRKKKRK